MPDEQSKRALTVANAEALSQGFVLIGAAALAWIFIESGMVRISFASFNGLPASTLPGFLWLVAAIRLKSARGLTDRWDAAASRLLAASFLHLYLVPYLGWWHAAATPAYRAINQGLLALSIGLGVVSLYQLAWETARRLGDQSLRAEIVISAVAVPFFALLLAFLLWRSAVRMGAAEVGWKTWIDILKNTSNTLRVATTLVLAMPFSPILLLMLELRSRIRHAIGSVHPIENRSQGGESEE